MLTQDSSKSGLRNESNHLNLCFSAFQAHQGSWECQIIFNFSNYTGYKNVIKKS